MDESIVVPKLNLDATAEEVCGFIRRIVEQSGARGVVVGLSGGVDSSLTAALCVRALGSGRVLGVLMPTSFTPQEDVEDAEELADQLGISTKHIPIQEINDVFLKNLEVDPEKGVRKAIANIRARIRMVILYYYANSKRYLVAGTGDRSEILIGYFTKYGDGGVDILPIGHLYKTQVRELAKHLGIPERVAYKPSSPQLYPGHKLLDELPLTYNDLDPILVGLFDKKLPPEEVSRLSKIPQPVVEDILLLHKNSEHKRSMPYTIKSG